MLNLSLTAVVRGPVRLQGEIPPHDPIWEQAGLLLDEPLRADLEATQVGDGVLVRGTIETTVAGECRRCLTDVAVRISDTVDLLYEPLSAEEESELGGEVYPLPERGDTLDLREALREHLVLRVPDFVVCSETCRGLCPQCGVDLNQSQCDCVPEVGANPWDALKGIKFD